MSESDGDDSEEEWDEEDEEDVVEWYLRPAYT